MKRNRPTVGIIIDYSLRIPDFIGAYKQLKEQIIVGSLQTSAGRLLESSALDDREQKNYWDELRLSNPSAVEFYEKSLIPSENLNKDFDITYQKYFYNREQRNQFLEDWSYNLFGQGGVSNKADVNMINIAQAKLCDIVLIDRCTHSRKVGNTFAFLARSGLFVKQVIFVTQEAEIKQLEKEFEAIWNPYTDSSQIIYPSSSYGAPTEHFMKWFLSLEQKLKK